MRKSIFAAFFVALGVLANLPALSALLGWSDRAPDVGYGDELSSPEGIILALLAVEFYRRKRRAGAYATAMIVLNVLAVLFGPPALSIPFAMLWVGIWIFFLAVARSQSSDSYTLFATTNQLGQM